MSETVFNRIVGCALLAVIAVVLARNAYGRRHWIAWQVARFAVFFVAALAIAVLMRAIGIRGWWVFYVAVGLSSPVYSAWRWSRSRHIPAAVRRKVIEKWEGRTGKRFDPKLYEIDHKVPFAKGGWHTTDNLRVVRRAANRGKGHREPTLEDWFRIWRRKDEE